MIPQTQLKSHRPQISTFKLPSPTKTTTVETSTVNIQLDPTSVPINRPKFFITISSINGNSAKASQSKPSKTYNVPQTNTMYSSPHEWTKHSNHTPPPSMATQPSISTTCNLPVYTHILVPSFQPNTIYVPCCAPLSSQLRIFDGSDFRYRPAQFLHGIKVTYFLSTWS